VQPPSAWRPGIPPAADELLFGALDPDPRHRPQSASQFIQALDLALEGASVELRMGTDLLAREEDGESAPSRHAGVIPVVRGGDDEDAQTDPPRSGPVRLPAADEGDERAATGGAQAIFPGVRSTGAAPAVTAPYQVPTRTSAPQAIPSIREPDLPAGAAPHTRGVLFRSAYRIMGARHGAVWVGQVSRDNPALGQALQPQSTLLSWHPTPIFVAMLHAVAAAGREPRQFARDLGRVATAATFSRFFGADPALLTPWHVLEAADLFWRRYHTWGTVSVRRREPDGAEVMVAGGPREPLVCASTSGVLEEVVRLAGATRAEVTHPRCEASGQDSCTFVVTWQLATQAG